MTTLRTVGIGQIVTVSKVILEELLVKRLYALGVRPGKAITVMRRFGKSGPIQIRIGTTDIIIRPNIAEFIFVVK